MKEPTWKALLPSFGVTLLDAAKYSATAYVEDAQHGDGVTMTINQYTPIYYHGVLNPPTLAHQSIHVDISVEELESASVRDIMDTISEALIDILQKPFDPHLDAHAREQGFEPQEKPQPSDELLKSLELPEVD